jgi:hypothetical protein
VPRGTPHQPCSPDGAQVLLVEPSATVNTGDTPSELTAERRVVGPGRRRARALSRWWTTQPCRPPASASR